MILITAVPFTTTQLLFCFSVYLFLPDSNHKFVKTSKHPAVQHPNFQIETPGGDSYSFGADNYIRAGGAEYVGVPVTRKYLDVPGS